MCVGLFVSVRRAFGTTNFVPRISVRSRSGFDNSGKENRDDDWNEYMNTDMNEDID